MKIKIEMDETLPEEEVIIRCRSLSEQVQQIQRAVSDAAASGSKMEFTKGDRQYFLSLEDILFFETDGGTVAAHTVQDMFQTKLKLYELEEMLPGYFMRISKSTILNTNLVYAINRNLTASSVVEFQHSHKQVYVSRHYYKALLSKLEEKRTQKEGGKYE